MSLRGKVHRASIAAVLDAFGPDADELVLIGSAALALYARPRGGPLRTTKDVDCISTTVPFILQDAILGRLCERGVLLPVPEVFCRYQIVGRDVLVDVLDPKGSNVGGTNAWFEPAVREAQRYEVTPERWIRAITPPYFLATKLVAFSDRAVDWQGDEDLEDIVAVVLEVEDLVARVEAAGIGPDIAALWSSSLGKHGLADPRFVPDIVGRNLHGEDRGSEARVVDALYQLVRG